MKSKIFIFTTLILVVFLFVITSCNYFLNGNNNTTININLDLSKIVKTSRNVTASNSTEYILKVFAYNAASYKTKDEIENLPLLTQTENKVDINGKVKARLDVTIGLNVIFVAKLYQGEAEEPIYAGKSEVIKIKTTNNKVHLVLTKENAVPKGFVLVKGTTIKGTETWIPSSEVFVSERSLTIPNLLVSDHEVTRGEYLEVMGSDPSTANANDRNGNSLTEDAVLNNPVNYVCWYDTLVYCNKRSIQENLTPCYTIKGSTNPNDWGGVPYYDNDTSWDAVTCNWNANGYRLPTEAEWEWLARGGQDYDYAGSDTLDEVAWYTDNTNDTGTREVKTKAPNGYGLYDMIGNVSEFCWDRPSSITATTPADGTPYGIYRVERGNHWCQTTQDDYTVSSSTYERTYLRQDVHGFRVVRTLAHTHKFSTEWTSNATHHWHASTCEHTTEVSEKGEHTYTNGICICGMREMVLIPAGTFQMGSTKGNSNNTPVHDVTITKSFYMGKYEVTQAEYEKYCSYTESKSPSSDYGDGDNYPAYYVSWYDALVYCNKRSMAEGLTPCYSISDSTDPEKWGAVPTESDDPLCDTWDAATCDWNANGYRLPTEAEWEYAARAGDNIVDGLTYSGTSDVNKVGEYAWYSSNSDNATHYVGTKAANAFGLYDMSGNVWEWCWNRYTDSYDTNTEGGNDPTGVSVGSNRVFRGGGWNHDSRYCSVICRGYTNGPYVCGTILGFRVVRTATEVIDHTHTFSTDWTKDETYHWHAATCGHTTEVSAKTEHSFNWEVTKEASCTEKGEKKGTCTTCGYEKTEITDEVEHTFGIWEVVTDPTTTTEGTSKRICSICNFEETKPIIAIPENFVLIPAGTFQMGSEAGNSKNKPVHQVTITKSFYMGKYEVTQAEYEKYCSYTGSLSPNSSEGVGDGDNYPVYYVSWYNALVYCNKRSMAEGLTPCYRIKESTDPEAWGAVPTSTDSTWDSAICNFEANGYRLPTEAEWEYAARAGDNIVDSLTYSGTSDVNNLGDYAWYDINSNNTTHEVGTMLPNYFGLYDMSGNVGEWCWNWCTDSYDTQKEGGSNPTGASSGVSRIARGGNWSRSSSYCAVSYRSYNGPSGCNAGIGFRVVRSATE